MIIASKGILHVVASSDIALAVYSSNHHENGCHVLEERG
jgi:hypothetical protein